MLEIQYVTVLTFKGVSKENTKIKKDFLFSTARLRTDVSVGIVLFSYMNIQSSRNSGSRKDAYVCVCVSPHHTFSSWLPCHTPWPPTCTLTHTHTEKEESELLRDSCCATSVGGKRVLRETERMELLWLPRFCTECVSTQVVSCENDLRCYIWQQTASITNSTIALKSQWVPRTGMCFW